MILFKDDDGDLVDAVIIGSISEQDDEEKQDA
jgi:hypothetical protein